MSLLSSYDTAVGSPSLESCISDPVSRSGEKETSTGRQRQRCIQNASASSAQMAVKHGSCQMQRRRSLTSSRPSASEEPSASDGSSM